MVQLYLIAELTESTVKECLEFGVDAKIQFTQAVTAGGHFKPKKCDALTEKPTGVNELLLILLLKKVYY